MTCASCWPNWSVAETTGLGTPADLCDSKHLFPMLMPKPMLPRLLLCVVCLAPPALAEAAQLASPPPGDDVVGEMQIFQASHADTLPDISRAYSVGFDEMTLANPKLDTWLPGDGAQVILPLQFVLPMSSREGVVINIPEMRVYHFPKGGGLVTYPVSIGRMDWNTPLGKTKVVKKDKDPAWYPPASIKAEHLRDYGEVLPDVVPPGPDNPLGGYALRLGIPGYLMHGTDARKAFGIGIRATHGCMRFYPEDIASFFNQVEVNTPVELVNQPVKLGWQADTLYLEVHPPLEEDALSLAAHLEQALAQFTARRPAQIDMPKALALLTKPDGLPHPIGQADPEARPMLLQAAPRFLPAEPAHIPLAQRTALPEATPPRALQPALSPDQGDLLF